LVHPVDNYDKFLLLDGPYHVFAGRDASRGLGTFSIDSSMFKESYDDLSDLNSMQVCYFLITFSTYQNLYDNLKILGIKSRTFMSQSIPDLELIN